MSGIRLHRWEPRTDSEGGRGVREVTVDWRSALADALLGFDVPTNEVINQFESLAQSPDYEVRTESAGVPPNL